MKKVLRIFKWIFLSIIGLLGLVAVVFLIMGVPTPDSLITKNVPKIRIGSALSVLLAPPSTPNNAILVGFDTNHNLLFRKFTGSFMADGDTDSIAPYQGILPFAAYGSSARRLKDSNTLLYLDVKNAEEDRDLLRLNLETGEKDTLFAGTSSVTSFGISPDDSVVLVYNEDHKSGINTLYKLPLNGDGPPRALCTFEGLVEVQGFDRQMGHAYVLQSFSEQDGKLYRVDLVSGAAELEFEEEAHSKFYHGTPFTWYDRHRRFLQTRNDSIAYYVRTGTSGLSKEFAVLWEYNTYTKALTQRSAELEGDVGHIALTKDERYLVYLYTNKGYSQLRAYDLVEGKNITLYDDPVNPVALHGNDPFLLHPVANKVYFSRYSLGSTELCVFDLDGAVFKIMDPDRSAPQNTEIAFEEFTYPTTGTPIGVMKGIHAFMYKPRNPETEKLPVLIVFHGGPDTYDIPYDANKAQMGGGKFAVITPNYRGSAGYGVTFEKSDDQVNRGRQLEDIKALVDWIRTREDLDSEKIVLMGSSWGGFMTMASLARYPDLFLGGISMNGATLDPDAKREAGLLVGWDEAEIGNREDPEIQATLRQVSPVTNAQNMTRPLFMYQGARDARVSVESARKIVKALEEKGGRNLWYIEAAEAGHAGGAGSPLEGIYLFSAMQQFMDDLIQ